MCARKDNEGHGEEQLAAGQAAKRLRSAFFARPATQIGSTAASSVAGQRIFADLLHFAARPATVRSLTCSSTAYDLLRQHPKSTRAEKEQG